jgi:hypothetical protein
MASDSEDWNVLTSASLEVLNLRAQTQVISPLQALREASDIQCIASGSPLDLFAAHRFLLTLLYWKAEVAGGVQRVRDALLGGEVPGVILDALCGETGRFGLFDPEAPFLQDPSAREAKTKSAGSLFAEFACGTNVAHFHHGDDERMRLCLPCATVGMMRAVPWTQSGGAGLSPSVHNAPPIVALAVGGNLSVTLGLNLIDVEGPAGVPRWSGHFSPTSRQSPIPYLEAFTWNPRRILLIRSPSSARCLRCGAGGVALVGSIVYLKNENTRLNKQGGKTVPFVWRDPSAFYSASDPHVTRKSFDEERAAAGSDLGALADEEKSASSPVVVANSRHQGWLVVVPSTNPANNKTYDHRLLPFRELTVDTLRAAMSACTPVPGRVGLDGWTQSSDSGREGPAQLVRAAASLLGEADWLSLSNAAFMEMQEAPAAFDALSGLIWSLRKRKIRGLPSRDTAWLVLKLMAAVPAAFRAPSSEPTFCPLTQLPSRQLRQRRGKEAGYSPYPVSFPRGRRLEAALRAILGSHCRKRIPAPIGWRRFCDELDQLLG